MILSFALMFGTPLATQASPVWVDVLFVSGQYKVLSQRFLLWRFRGLYTEGGLGAVAIYSCQPSFFGPICNWGTHPILTLRLHWKLFSFSPLEITTNLRLVAPFLHHEGIMPRFLRVDLFLTGIFSFQWTRSFSVYGELGIPLGWQQALAAVGTGFHLRF